MQTILLRSAAPTGQCTDTVNNLWRLGLDYGASNNGDLMGGTISDGASWSGTQNFSYDKMNRLNSAEEPALPAGQGWKRTFGYDRWGNLWVDGTNSSGIAVDAVTPIGDANSSAWITAKNRMNLPAGSYDLAGNQVRIGSAMSGGGYFATYDGENRMKSLGAAATYSYDGDGRRVVKTSGNVTTLYVYDALGRLAQEYTIGATSATPSCTTCYLLTDQLGSTRVLWDTAGVRARYDYMPFGELIPSDRNLRSNVSCAAGVSTCYAGDGTLTMRFTGKERDTEAAGSAMSTGLDYFGARYYAAAMGRWATPDAINLTDDRIRNPSNTLNKYVYGANNPLKYVDPDGRDITVFYETPSLFPPGAGHILFTAENEQTGDAAAMSFGPIREGFGDAERTLAGFPQVSTSEFGLAGMTADQLRQQYSSLTIRTTPEEAQQVIDWIKRHGGVQAIAGGYMLYDQNCTTVCREALKTVNKLVQGDKDWTPTGLWKTLFSKYSHPYWQNNFNWVGNHPGVDYGEPRWGFDPFQLLEIVSEPCADSWNGNTNTLTGCQ